MFGMFPKNDLFFDHLNDLVKIVRRGSELMLELCKNPERRSELIGAIREVEHQGDRIIRDIQKLLVKSFITPIDREDIHALSSSLDDVVDFIDDAANCFLLFQVGEPIAEYTRQVEILVSATGHLQEAVDYISAPKSHVKCRALVYKIYDLESEGDGVYGKALARLFQEEGDVRTLIKWKELCGDIEGALDACQKVGNTLELIVLKAS